MAETNPPAIRILMLHGFTNSGSIFHAKTKALEKHLRKAFPGLHLSYPTGPVRLDPKDIPGYDPSDPNASDIEGYGWWRRSDTADPPEYLDLDRGLETIADVLRSEGPFDGVVGFSQGACAAAFVASLLEGESRKRRFQEAQRKDTNLAIPFPAAFEGLQDRLKFGVAYCGFLAPGPRFQGFYEGGIETPMLHVLGSLDSVVEESRSKALINACGGESKTQVLRHPGGHFVPSSRQYLDGVVEFIKQCLGASERKDELQGEENVEDMEVPF
ncbi:MAG: hypothetical protein Q9160_007337 [Pyrenula sp. 1 TL-2023]